MEERDQATSGGRVPFMAPQRSYIQECHCKSRSVTPGSARVAFLAR